MAGCANISLMCDMRKLVYDRFTATVNPGLGDAPVRR
jgi:hypothetical protein